MVNDTVPVKITGKRSELYNEAAIYRQFVLDLEGATLADARAAMKDYMQHGEDPSYRKSKMKIAQGCNLLGIDYGGFISISNSLNYPNGLGFSHKIKPKNENSQNLGNMYLSQGVAEAITRVNSDLNSKSVVSLDYLLVRSELKSPDVYIKFSIASRKQEEQKKNDQPKKQRPMVAGLD